ncbi:hypothetical protein [Vibrio azureus]|nr:hypothetical protein [Vibrio azureus]
MADLLLSCPDCSKQACVKLGQVDRRNNLAWFRSWNCENCGLRIEEDGDETPNKIREILINEEGAWALILSEVSKKASAFKILRDVIGLSLQDVARLRKDKSGCVFIGTKEEVNFYQRKCGELGLELLVIDN